MSSWLWAVLLALQAHFGASYVVPIQPHLGVFNYLWPWAVGDHGLFGAHPNLLGIALGGSAGTVSALAAFAVVGIWVPYDWWWTLATVGAVLELVLMIGFFGPTKLLPIALDLAVLAAVLIYWLPVRDSQKLKHPRLCIMRSRLSSAGGTTMDLTDSLKALFVETAHTLKGSARRLFMARTVKELGPGGQRRAERELGWNRETIRKGTRELESGLICLDNFAARGRKKAEDHLPNLLTDIAAIVDSQSQADPQFRTQRLYTRLDAAEVRRQLIAQKGYTDTDLPTVQTITTKLNALGYYPQKVAKSQPKKRSPKPTRSSTK